MPAIISVNRNYVTLDETISTEEATAFLTQAKIPGFEAGIFNLSQLIFETAQYRISFRLLNARQIWERVIPDIPYSQYLNWLNVLSVLQAATLIFELFGPVQADITEQVVSLDAQLRLHDWGWLMSDPTVEDTIFCSILQLVNRVEPAATPERLRELSKILVGRLPIDCHQTTLFKQQMALLSPHCLSTETPRSVCNRLKNILFEARQIVREAAVFMSLSDGAIKVNATGKLIPRSVAKPVVKPVAKTQSQGRNDRCATCGVFGHVSSNCRNSHLPGCNRTTIPWIQSNMGKAWKSIGLERVTEGITCPSVPTSSGAVSSTTPYVPRAPTASNRQNGTLNTVFVSAISPSLHSPNDFLTVSISLQSQTNRLAAEAANRVVVVEGEGIKTSAEALLDTGALMGNYVNTRVVEALKAENYVYLAKTPISVCSGLDNVCYTTNKMLDILVTYVHEITKSKISISLSTFISPSSPIDLIIGRATIKKHNFFDTTPSQIRNKTKPTKSVTPIFGMKNDMKTVFDAENEENVSPVTPVCTCAASHISEVVVSTVPLNLDMETGGNDSYDLHRSQRDLHPLPLETCNATQYDTVAAMLLSPVLHVSQVVDDEIDNETTDTFFPFLPQPLDDPDDFINLITFGGDEYFQRTCKALCLEFRDLFSDKLGKLPADIPPFDLKVDDEKWRVYQNRAPVRLQTPAKEEEINRQIQTLLAADVIEISTAPYFSQVMLANKPDGRFRFCIDYRRLNDCTESASWPLPLISAMFARIGRHKSDMFCVVDLTSGYHQAPLTDQAKKYTSFTCYAGLYQFKRLPFGPKRAPSYFQEMMCSVVLQGFLYNICEMYVDDCIIHGKGNEELLERLRMVFTRFREKRILLQPKKCKFGLEQVEYVGKLISKDGISMTPSKIQSIVAFPKPMTNHTMRSFLGLANFIRDYVSNHSHLAHPLHAMITDRGKNHPVVWTAEAEVSFTELKARIQACPLLYFANDKEPIVLMTDASDYGIGGHLFQKVIINNVEEVHTVAFVSKSLTETQLRWSTIQKEAYAIFYCCTHLGHLLRDRHFLIRTDHRNLTFMSLDSNAMVIRWYIALQEFDYSIEFVPGRENDVADTLSRLCPNLKLPTPSSVSTVIDIATPIHTLSAIVPDRDISADNFATIAQCHNAVQGHGGVERTLSKLHSLNKRWLYMTQDVKKFISQCACCQKMSQTKIPIHALKYTTSTFHTMENLNIDFVGPYPDGWYVMVIIDTFTRWVELYPCVAATSEAALTALLQHFGRFGCPRSIRSDRGSHFANELIKEFLLATGTPHNLTLAYSSEENSIVERVNKEVNRHIRAYTFDNDTQDNWRMALPFVQRILNSSRSQRTGISPAELLFGKQIQLDQGILLPFREQTEDITPLSTYVANLLTIQAKLVDLSQTLLKATDAKHLAKTAPILTEFEIGTHVLVAYAAGPPTRLHTQWKGPLKILARQNEEYLLLDLVTSKEKLYHVKNMRIFKFNQIVVDPLDIARRDSNEFYIEKILAHLGDFKKVSTLTFRVRWMTYTSAFDTWEPWANLRRHVKLHDYLRSINKSYLIPR